MKIKLKDAKIKGWQKKKKELPRHTSYGIGDEDYESGITIGFNRALNLIGNLEFNPADYVELDVGKIEKILNQDVPYLESSSNKIDRVHASIQRANNKTYANCIVKAFNSGELI